MSSNVTEASSQPQSLKEYSIILKEKLHPRLSHCLALTAEARPPDPIEFLSTHLRHLSSGNKADEVALSDYTSTRIVFVFYLYLKLTLKFKNTLHKLLFNLDEV